MNNILITKMTLILLNKSKFISLIKFVNKYLNLAVDSTESL